MKIQNKCALKTATSTKISVFALILLLAMTFLMVFTQPSFAQIGVPQPEKTVGYISVAPTLVGVGQTATVNLWIFPLPTTYLYSPYYGCFTGITMTFIKPDGTKDTFKPVDGTGQYDPGQTEATGSLYFFYEPDMAGDWSVSFTMPAQDITDSTGTVQYMACTSEPAYFTVTEEEQLAGLLNGYPWAQLPNENTYWDYPISSNNREWSQISGDWLGSNIINFPVSGATCRLWQPYGSGPNTAHIVWKQPLKAGGIIGGDYGSLSYASAISMPSAVIMEGKAFTNIPNENNFECIDLTTGKILYKASGQITAGIHLPGNPNAQSIFDPSVVLNSSYGSSPTSYLFGGPTISLIPGLTTWNYYDPLTGSLMMSIANSTASSYTLADGTNLAYGTTIDGQLFGWDLSKIIANNFLTSFAGPSLLTGDWPAGIMWITPLPVPITAGSTASLAAPSIFGISADLSTVVIKTSNEYWGFSTEDGTQLWHFTLTYPVAANEEISLYGVDDFIVFDPTDTTFHCYSMLTGDELWVSDSFADSPWATTWTVYWSETNDYNNLYLMFPDGTMAALSLATGKEVWHNTAFPSTEYTYNVVPYVSGMLMVGGNIYAYAGYSIGYQINPIPRFAMMTCVNASTGNITYTLNGGVWPLAAANGYVIGLGIYDGNLYCVGKGQTSTSVTIQDDVVAKGDTVLIKGNVLDQSPASQDYASQVRFPNGVPAVADEDMSEFMDYLHMQNATLLNNPPMPNGVPVTIDAIDPSGDFVHIGDVTSDFSSMFKMLWTPEEEGEYTILAGFSGSDSYWSSYAETALGVTEAPSPAGPIQPEPTEPTEAPLITTEVAIIIAVAVIAVIAIVAYWALKRRK
jgi:hypothetical protein